MNETAEEIDALQALLDRSHAAGGTHLKRLIRPANRLSAEQVCARLQDMVLLALATTTSKGAPMVGPVDGIFLHGSFHFGSAPDSMRLRHIDRDPRVSATHLPGEELAVTVHGRAVPADHTRGPFRQALLDVYVPRYGPEYEAFIDSGVRYMRIEAERMFTYVPSE